MPMQLRNQIKLRLLQASLEQFGKEVVIAIPLSLLIERNHKQVSMFKGFQPRMAWACLIVVGADWQRSKEIRRFGTMMEE